MSEIVCNMFAADRGQPSRAYNLTLSSGEQVKVDFNRDLLTGMFLWRYPQDAEGNPTDPKSAEILSIMQELFVPKPGTEQFHGSYMRMVPYTDLPKDTSKLGKTLSTMVDEDFDVWLEDAAAGDASLIEAGLQALNAIRSSPKRQRALRIELKKLREEEGVLPPATEAPAAAPTPPPAPAAAPTPPPAPAAAPTPPPAPAAATRGKGGAKDKTPPAAK